MSAWSKILGPEERAEVESLVVAAYVDQETGETRPTREAKAEFVAAVESASQAGRTWADIMAEDWMTTGAGNFAAALWKRRDAFTATATGVQRTRALHRGKKVRRDDGSRVDVQESLLSWSVADLKDAIVAEVMRTKEARFNLETYAKLVRLCEETGIEPVDEALASLGLTLEEYLAQDEQAATG